jgi:NAD(P)-dependent dehydrogenase (short-subunit alcohol dehydrogenase family)
VGKTSFRKLFFERLTSFSQQQWQNQLDTNLFGSMNVTKALLPHFRERKTGRIGFTSSIFSFSSIVGGGPYAISKHGLAGK